MGRRRSRLSSRDHLATYIRPCDGRTRDYLCVTWWVTTRGFTTLPRGASRSFVKMATKQLVVLWQKVQLGNLSHVRGAVS
jgi:hypothetical protein